MDIANTDQDPLGTENAQTTWIRYRALRTTANSCNWHLASHSTAPKPIGTSEPSIPKYPFESFSGWPSGSAHTLQQPFRLFGEIVPSLTGTTMKVAMSTIVQLLNRHHKLLMLAASAQTELTRLAKQFEAQLVLLSTYFDTQTSSMDGTQVLELAQSVKGGFKLLLERSEALESDFPTLSHVSFTLRLFLVHTLGTCYHYHKDNLDIRSILDHFAVELLQAASKIAPTLCRLSREDLVASPYYQSQLRLLQLLFYQYAVLEPENSKGKAIWTLVSICADSLSGESGWSLLLLSSAINTNRLFKSRQLQYYADWEVVQALLNRDLLQTPKQARSSPTKDPNGPSLGIQDLIQRVKYLCLAWGPPTLDIVSLLTRFFSGRLSTVNSSVDFSEDAALEISSNAFDTFLYLLSHSIFTQTTMEDRKIRWALAKCIESFLNILEDLPSTNYHPDAEVPALLRNAFQFSMAVIPVMTDTDAKTILLERLFSLNFEQLSPVSRKVALHGMFKLLASASKRKVIARPNRMNEDEMQTELANIYGHLENYEPSPPSDVLEMENPEKGEQPFVFNPEADLIPLPETRKRIVEFLTSTLQNFIVPHYITIASSSHGTILGSNSAVNTTTATHLAQLPSKRQKTLEVDYANSPYLKAEKLVLIYLKQTINLVSNRLSSASLDLVSQSSIGELISNLNTSHSVRHTTNLLLRQLIISTRCSTLEPLAREKLDSFWQLAARTFQFPSLPAKVVQLLAELQGILLFGFSGDPKKNWTEFLKSGMYGRDAVWRSVPLHALHAWLGIAAVVLKQSVYTSAVIPTEMCTIPLVVLLNASLEVSSVAPAFLETVQRAHGIALDAPPPAPPPLQFSSRFISASLLEMCQRSPPPGIFAKLLVSALLDSRSKNAFPEFNPYLTTMLQHIDEVILKNRKELVAAHSSPTPNTKLNAYDDTVYPFVVFLLKTVPTWLYSRNNVQYNVFGRLASELFIAPIRAMSPDSAPIPSSHSSSSASSSTLGSKTATGTATNASTKSVSGMIFGKNRLPKMTSSTSASANPASSASYSTSMVMLQHTRPTTTPAIVNDNAIRFLPALLHSIAQLDFETDADLQRYTCEITVSIFKCFASGQDGSPDARLIEQFAVGLTSFQSGSIPDTTPSTAKPSSNSDYIANGLHVKISSFRTFWLANALPWLKGLIERDSSDAVDTNSFVIARILSWIFVKMKHAGEPALELVSTFLLSVHFVLDLSNARKPTKSALAKKEMLGFFTIFCSTLLKIVPNASPLDWLKTADAHLSDLLQSALNEIILAIIRDLEYISTASWPTSSSDAMKSTSLRMDYVNGIFQRTVDHTVSLSSLALLDRQGPIEGLKAEANALIEVLDFIRQIGGTSLIADVQERIRGILYVPPGSSAQRHARADIKAALEVARKGFGKLSYFIPSKQEPQ